jgi:hypothetical protein
MKLYLWEGVLRDWTSGMMFAIASSEEEARAKLLKECSFIPEEDLELEPDVIELDKPFAALCWGGG